MYEREKAEGLSVLIALIGVVAGFYILAWRGKRPAVRRWASLIVAVIFAVAGLWGMVAYGIPVLGDFHNPEVPIWEAVIETLIMWVICLVPWIIAVRFTTSALRKEPSPAAPSPEASPHAKP
jgi:hypothetical protein